MNTPAAQNAEKETTRIEAFSDGVYAIVVTLLVLDIKVPKLEEADHGGLLAALLLRWPNFLAFIASFFFVLVMWVNHHRLFTVIRRSDNNLLLLNGLLLFGVTLVPFPTALVAEYLGHKDQTLAVIVYDGWFLIVAIFFNLLWWYAAHKNRLFSAKTDQALVAHIARQYSFGPPFYFVALLVAFISPPISLAITVLLAVFFALPNRNVQKLMETE